MLTETNFPTWFLNSVIVAAFTMVIGVFMSATTGYALSRFNFPGRRQLMLVFLVTQMFPVAILIVPIYNIMARLGLHQHAAGAGHRVPDHRGAVLRLDAQGLLRLDPDASSTRRGASTAAARSPRSGG